MDIAQRCDLEHPNETPTDTRPAAVPPVPSDWDVGRRPLSRRSRSGRRAAMVAAICLLMAATGAALRYGWPRDADQWQVIPGDFRVTVGGPGTLGAINQAALGARVQGRLVGLYVDRNDTVAAGDLVALVAAEDLANQVTAAIATRDAAERAVQQAGADRDHARAALANARTAFERERALLSRGWATQAAYDSALATYRQSEADLARASAAVAASEAQERSAAATVEVNRAQRAEAVIRAPFAGLIVSRDRTLGDLVTPETSVVQLVDQSSIVLTARFDESAIASVHPGQAATLTFVSEPDRTVPGRVLRLSRQVDTETREFTVDIVPDVLPVNWAIGQRGTAAVTVATHAGVLSVPGRFLVRKAGQDGVWMVDDGDRAHWRPVTCGAASGSRVEIANGLVAGDTVIAPKGAFAGMRVRRMETAP